MRTANAKEFNGFVSPGHGGNLLVEWGLTELRERVGNGWTVGLIASAGSGGGAGADEVGAGGQGEDGGLFAQGGDLAVGVGLADFFQDDPL